MLPITWLDSLRLTRRSLCLCRGCLGVVVEQAEAGLCARCWAGLLSLPEERCPRYALAHGEGACPEPTAWDLGEALWDYHGGDRPWSPCWSLASSRGRPAGAWPCCVA